jgi:hypothetical protein
VGYLHEVGQCDKRRADGVVALLQDREQIDILERLGFVSSPTPGFVTRPGSYLVSDPEKRLKRRRA